MWPMQLCLEGLFWYTHVHTVRRIWQSFPTLSLCFLLSFHSKSLLLPMGPGRPLRPGQTGMGPVRTDQYKPSLSVEGTEWILTRTSESRFECIQKVALSHMCVHGEGVKKKQGSGSMKVNRGKVTEYKCCFFKLSSVFVFVHMQPTLSSLPVLPSYAGWSSHVMFQLQLFFLLSAALQFCLIKLHLSTSMREWC